MFQAERGAQHHVLRVADFRRNGYAADVGDFLVFQKLKSKKINKKFSV